MKILVTNDDGVRSPGLAALAQAMAQYGDVVVCAPEREQSAVSRSLTMSRPLRLEKADVPGIGFPCWAVDGTPTDCVKLAINKLFGSKPDFVVSGINRGPNLGTDVLFSGTVSAAMEGAMQGIPSIAVSLGWGEAWDFACAARWAGEAIGIAMRCALPFGTIVNINIPNGSRPKGIRVAPLGVLDYREDYLEREDPRGKKYYWLAGDKIPANAAYDTDDAWSERGYITVTPLKFDITDHSMMDRMRDLFSGFEENGDMV